MNLCLWLSGINFGSSGFHNKEQLVSPCCHFLHLKGSAVFCKSMFPLYPNDLVIISPHIMATIIDPFLLSLNPEIALAQFTGGSHPLLVHLAGSSYRHIICVWTWDTVPRGCIHVWVILITPGWFWARGSQILSNLWTSCHRSTYWTNSGPRGAGRTGRFPPSLFRTGPVSSLQNQFRCVLVTQVELGLTPTSISGDQTQVLLMW